MTPEIPINWQIVAFIIFLAVALERTIEFFFKMFPRLAKYNTNDFKLQLFVSFVLSLMICWGADWDIFKIANIPFKIPYFGYIFVAAAMAGGATGVHALFSKKEAEKELAKLYLVREQYWLDKDKDKEDTPPCKTPEDTKDSLTE